MPPVAGHVLQGRVDEERPGRCRLTLEDGRSLLQELVDCSCTPHLSSLASTIQVSRVSARLEQGQLLGIGADHNVCYAEAVREIAHHHRLTLLCAFLRHGHGCCETRLMAQGWCAAVVLRELADRVRVQIPPSHTITELPKSPEVFALSGLLVAKRCWLHAADGSRQSDLERVERRR